MDRVVCLPSFTTEIDDVTATGAIGVTSSLAVLVVVEVGVGASLDSPPGL